MGGEEGIFLGFTEVLTCVYWLHPELFKSRCANEL